MKRKSNIMRLVTAAMIAALYVVLSLLSNAFGLASGAIQLRISEALTVLPAFTATAIPGLTIGCFLFNLLSGAALPDIIFGSLATLLGAIGAWSLSKLTKKAKWAACLIPVPTILSNAIIIPWVLKIAYHLSDGYWYLFLTVGIGELLSCGALGMLVYFTLKPLQQHLFP